ncbi:hypothetical protein [Paraburkholderia pallida]|uniref:Uncharacterized protein n=1 Tax=Paraburkholderia pallida TaxID=2547399 RepID=A0A4P7D7P4_9BURK|nr:hypothetical protein [Paraburkholderia pallida]QBR04208.1 hypothetical protein E1956_44585 [Paraburkholderia pallida]
MIDVDVPLLTHEHKRLPLREAAGERGLVAVGVGRASGRGFEMLHHFAAACDRLDASGVNVVFVYPAQSARHVQDSLSVIAARYRRKPSLLLDDAGRFFGDALPVHLLRAIRLDRQMACIETTAVNVRDSDWDGRLREFLLKAGADAA